MKVNLRSLLSQPLVSIVTVIVAMALIAESWLLSPLRFAGSQELWNTLVFGVVLAASLSLAKYFPIHVRYVTKIEMGSVPLFLLAVLLPIQIGALAAGAGIAVAEITWIKKSGLYPSDVMTQSARLALVVFLGAVIAHGSSEPALLRAALLVAAALAMLAADILTTPLIYSPITGEPPSRVIAEMARALIPTESGQYALGLIGATLAWLNQQDVWAATLLILPIALLYKTSKRKMELHVSTRVLLETMADNEDSRDPYTHDHSKRVAQWTQDVLKELNVVGQEAQIVLTAARVHDIGKMSVPDAIRLKHGRLTDEEWAIMEGHTIRGAELVSHYPAFARGAAIVRGHHERWDGSGYPDRLRATDIPFGARLIAVVDSFDAMVNDRPYRAGMTWERAAALLRSGGGTQWDPQMVDALLRVIEPRLSGETAGSGVMRVVPAGRPATL